MKTDSNSDKAIKKPDWIRVKIGGGPSCMKVKDIVHKRGLHTVCEEALCPNMGQCWENGRATIMILGDICSRNCGFCGVLNRCPSPPDPDEPRLVAEAVAEMGLSDIVLTSVTRDDLPDGGSAIWAETIHQVRQALPEIIVEVLIPDFEGVWEPLKLVMDRNPDVLAHNLETVPSLYPEYRPQADYRRSLELLKRASDYGLIAKTGIMVGIGETTEEVVELMKDSLQAGCSIMTIGQYLQPTSKHLPVTRYVEPSEFDHYREIGLEMGFKVVLSAPLVRSSFYSEEQDRFVRDCIRQRNGS